MTEPEQHQHHHVCPVWAGYFLASPFRAIFQNPRKILVPYVNQGMHVLDVGCAMGYFSLPLARLVGTNGRVICVDLQQRMLDSLLRRARRKKLDKSIEVRLCGSSSLSVADLAGRIDFALAFAVVHEVSDPSRLFTEIHTVLKPESRVIVAEPKGRVTIPQFEKSIATAEACGFDVVETPKISRSLAVILKRKRDSSRTLERTS